MEMYEDNFWGRVKQRAEANGMTLARLAQEAGVNYHVMTNQICNGTIPKKPGVCEAMAKVLGCSVDYLVTGEAGSVRRLSEEVQDVVDDYTFLDAKKKRAVKALLKYLVAEQEEDNYQFKVDNGLAR